MFCSDTEIFFCINIILNERKRFNACNFAIIKNKLCVRIHFFFAPVSWTHTNYFGHNECFTVVHHISVNVNMPKSLRLNKRQIIIYKSNTNAFPTKPYIEFQEKKTLFFEANVNLFKRESNQINFQNNRCKLLDFAKKKTAFVYMKECSIAGICPAHNLK